MIDSKNNPNLHFTIEVFLYKVPFCNVITTPSAPFKIQREIISWGGGQHNKSDTSQAKFMHGSILAVTVYHPPPPRHWPPGICDFFFN